MKKTSIVLGVLIVLAFSFGSIVPQNGYDLFQKALAKERAEGNLEEAIALYQQVVKEAKDESLSAKAQLRIGICFEKLGEKKEKQAQTAYQMVIDNYPQQVDSVKVAKEKLSNLIRIQAVEKKDLKEFNIRKIWGSPKLGRGNLGEVSPDGRYLSISDIEGKIAAFEFATQKRHYITGEFFTGKKKGTSEKGEASFIKGDFPVWAPDGSQITYNRKKYSELCVIGSNNTDPIVLYKSKGDEQVNGEHI